MQRLIVGLGNPGDKYKNNRHNVGHIVVEALLKRPHHGFIVKKSQEFMNDSGIFVKRLIEQYRLNISDLWVIHDDLDIPLGSYKIRKSKGPKLHNGVNSIERELGSDDFWRVRVGVDNRNPNEKMAGEEYVLQDFTPQEKEILGGVIEEICKKLATS